MSAFTITYDIHDGARNISRTEHETINEPMADDETKKFFEGLGKLKYGDKFIRIRKIEKENDNSNATIVFETTQDDV